MILQVAGVEPGLATRAGAAGRSDGGNDDAGRAGGDCDGVESDVAGVNVVADASRGPVVSAGAWAKFGMVPGLDTGIAPG